MHTLLIHPNFPSQFGHLAQALAARPGDKVTFLTAVIPPDVPMPFDVVTYKLPGRPIERVFHGGKTPEDMMELAKAAFTTCFNMPDLRPDVVLGHGTYGTFLFLRSLYDAKFVCYHEILPPPFWSDDFNLRPDFPPSLDARCFNAVYHTFTHLQLHACHEAYSPTLWQKHTAPREYRNKIQVIHDGIDTDFFCRHDLPRPYEFHGLTIGKDTKVITYLSRGLESFRGFDIFMRAMKIVCRENPNVLVLVAGAERTVYGHDENYTGGLSFKRWVLSQDDYPLDRIKFVGWLPVDELPLFWSLSNLNIYLTVPWVLSWSCVQAMACGCTMLVSDTAPLKEVITDGWDGMKAGFFDTQKIAAKAILMLKDAELSHELSRKARQTVELNYSLPVCIPRIIDMLERGFIK